MSLMIIRFGLKANKNVYKKIKEPDRRKIAIRLIYIDFFLLLFIFIKICFTRLHELCVLPNADYWHMKLTYPLP